MIQREIQNIWTYHICTCELHISTLSMYINITKQLYFFLIYIFFLCKICKPACFLSCSTRGFSKSFILNVDDAMLLFIQLLVSYSRFDVQQNENFLNFISIHFFGLSVLFLGFFHTHFVGVHERKPLFFFSSNISDCIKYCRNVVACLTKTVLYIEKHIFEM